MSVAQEQTAYIHHSQDTEFNQQDSKIEIKCHYSRYYLEGFKLEKVYPNSLDKIKSEPVINYLGRKIEEKGLMIHKQGRSY